ncbi:MAG: type II secretion system protein [Gimesia sp.]|nr:type II secretion system protein [Gimesia sp.]
MKKSPLNRMMQYRQQTEPCPSYSAGGFTLVEMIVSVALVLLMMLMFAEIFQIASNSITAQRGLSENDQRARMLTTLIQADLNKRTFQNVTPFDPTEGPTTNLSAFSDRLGYLMISENDPDNDADDLIQFTADATITTNLLDTTPYFGKATVLGGNILTHPNQPETDDAKISPDNASQSPYAEICYFMRGGNLYRRTLLIRKPLDLETTTTTQPDTSQTTGGLLFFDPATPALYRYVDNFWNDFDFSAYRAGTPTSYANFHDVNSLDNTTILEPVFSLGRPNYRFGYNHATGLPREYVDDSSGTAQFIGRFTHQETSDPDFLYPQANSTAGGINPMNPASSSLEFDRATNVVSQYSDGLRRAEDLVLSNVLSFDIKLFDQMAGQFVDIGGATAVDYAASATPDYHNNNPNSTTFARNIFDTWHIQHDIDNADSDNDFTTGADNPPFKPGIGTASIRPLSAIQITIRYRDISSQQIRQMTIIQPLRHLVED